jgi:hypothetical protein
MSLLVTRALGYILYRQRVREQIARDRAERALQGKGTAVLQTQSQSSKPSVTKEYTSCRLQVSYNIQH